jgi:hypothetical protein
MEVSSGAKLVSEVMFYVVTAVCRTIETLDSSHRSSLSQLLFLAVTNSSQSAGLT